MSKELSEVLHALLKDGTDGTCTVAPRSMIAFRKTRSSSRNDASVGVEGGYGLSVYDSERFRLDAEIT